MSKIALVHDYFIQQGGAERVAAELYRVLNAPDVFTTVALPDGLPPALSQTQIRTSWMQRLPAIRRMHRIYFPLYPFAVRALNLKSYDLVVSSSSGYAKGVRSGGNATHVCYCHTPMRWIWRYRDYVARERFGRLTRLVLPMFLNGLRMWDKRAAREPDQFVANSHIIAERIWDVYKREAIVIPPPIDVNRFRLSYKSDDYYLVLSRLVSYKNIDIAIEACKLLNRRLIVIGDGPDRARLESFSSPLVTFAGRICDTEVEKYVAGCRALLLPGEEDFGMAPLEVAAAGKPTVALRAGGAIETIVDGSTGVFFDASAPKSMAEAIERCENVSWSAALIRRHACNFDAAVFRQRFLELLQSLGATVPDVPKCKNVPVPIASGP
jgi:glycosyltransferase involved in cell wall biosynthesis